MHPFARCCAWNDSLSRHVGSI